ncbi:transmembrane protein 81 [Heliangelus exortis]|uniref:transmembrane protein 81 n=1 Tax=Heliangelus exortis TaxID=472823 RepID=UPI003A8ED83C
MKAVGSSHILGVLCCAFYLPFVASVAKITIPAELSTAVAEIAVNATSCSVTCGPGFKLEEICEMTAAGERRNCSLRRSGCLTSWACGLLHFTVPVGKPFQMSCLNSAEIGFGTRVYFYTWKFAQSLITTNDVLFKPFRNPGSAVSFSPTRESDAGTYRCDMQMVKTFRVIKRIYFGVRVIPSELVDLNFQKSLTWEQKLTASKEEGEAANGTQEEGEELQPCWQGRLFYEFMVGIGSGVTGGVLVGMALCFVQRIMQRVANKLPEP